MLVLCASGLLGFIPAMAANSQQPNEFTIPLGYFEYIPIVALSNETFIAYSTSSNVSISTAFMSGSQFNSFNSTGDDIANSLSDQNGTRSSHSLAIGSGTYYLVFYAYSGDANVTYNYRISPNAPYQNGPMLPPQPTGIASFGVYNYSGNVVPYEIKTDEVVGVANISSILSYNSTAASVNDTLSGATLQLNSMLVVNDQSGTSKVYWAQDTPDFVTNSSVVSYADNVWNNTDSSGSLSNDTIVSQSGGYVLVANSSGQVSDYYAYGTANSSYALPFDVSLIMNESVVGSQGILLQMGVSILRNGTSLVASPINWFDNITINDPSVRSAYFYTSGNDSTPVNTYYDTELVFGGEGNGESTKFINMNSSLGLYYYNETSGSLDAFPSYYSFGGDTAEAADNLHVTYSGDGIAQVEVGTPNYVYLSSSASSSSTFSTGSLTSALLHSSGSTTTTLSSSAEPTITPTSGATTSPSPYSSPNVGVLIPAALAIIVIVVVVLGIYLSVRRRPPSAQLA